MQKIISSKFAKKIVNIECIEDLEMIVETEEMMIPADVRFYDREEFGEKYDENDLAHAKSKMETKKIPPVFRVSLEVSSPDSDYPEEIKELMAYLTNKGLKSESIFRRSPNKEKVDEIISLMNEHTTVKFDNYDIYTLASVLKEFIRDLQDTLIPKSSYSDLMDISLSTMEGPDLLKFVSNNIVRPLDDRSKKLLKDLMMLSAMTAQLSTLNRMSSKALAVVWAPNLIRMENRGDEMKIIVTVIKVVECMIDNYDKIFCDTSDW